MIRDFYKDRTILLTGATGFLGKGLVAKILRDLPEVAKLYLLIRPQKRPDGTVVSAAERLREDCLANSVFDRFKEEDPRGLELALGKVVALSGDIMAPDLGLEDHVQGLLQEELDLVINSAATVEFDAPLDFSITLNALGPMGLLEFARSCRREVTFLQVSTAYVSGKMSGSIPERPLPLDRTISQMMGTASTAKFFDPQAEIETCQARCRQIREQAASSVQQQAFRQEILDQSHSRRPSAARLEKLIADRSKSWIRHQLVSEGMRRARDYGWNDIYTFTKAMGEQMLVKNHRELPLVIVRPSVIESSLKDPEPGWISGLKVSDPLIVAYGRGLVPNFPARRRSAMDIIPVDLVVNAILGAATRATRGEVPVFQVASSAENPLTNEVLYKNFKSHFHNNPMRGRDGRIPVLREWTFPSRGKFKILFNLKYMYPLSALQWLFKLLPGRLVPAAKKRSLVALKTRLQRVLYYTELFSPYTHLDCRFESSRTQALYESLPVEEQRIFDMDVRQIDWAEYYPNIHLPGLRKHVLKEVVDDDPLLQDVPEEVGVEEKRWHEEENIETLPDLLNLACSRYADRIALQIERDGRWVRYSYRELQQKVAEMASLWQQKGLEPGQCVLLWVGNSPEWVMAYMAASSLGLTVVPLDPHSRAEEIWKLAEFTEARALVTSVFHFEALSEELVAAHRRAGMEFFDLNNSGQAFFPEQGDASSVPLWKQPNIAPEMVASIIFTSGTAAIPRGVQLTHGNFIAGLLGVVEMHQASETDQILSVLPLYHGLEFSGGLLMSILGGATTTYLETVNSREILEAIRTTGTTILLSVPRLLKILAHRVQRLDCSADLATLRLVFSGGGPLSSEICAAYQKLGIKICEGYGLTEAAPIVTVNPADRPRFGSVGTVLPGQEIHIRQFAGAAEGEILVRGANVAMGYLKRPEITAAMMRDGWLHTGDIGYLDPEGYLFITGRCKNMIVTGAGKNVYPDEVEALYRDLPHVSELGVLGVYSARIPGEEIHGVAVIEGGAIDRGEEKKLEDEIRARSHQVSRTLPTYHRIQRLHIWSRPLPRLDGGEVDRAALLDELQLKHQ